MKATVLACALFLAGCSGKAPLFSGNDLPEPRVRTPYDHDLAALGDRDAESIFECLSMLMWFEDPPQRDYRVENPLGLETPGREDGGGDGFVPYCMGRYFGFVPSNI